MANKRIFYLDELRAIAIFAVILCHVANIYPYLTTSIKTAIPYFCSDLGRIGVPIFFMLSGALLLNREYDLGSFFNRRFKRILIPFIFWVIVTSILKFTVFGDNVHQIVAWCLGNPGLTWYIWELIGVYFFIPVVNSFVREYGMKGVKYYLALWLVTVLFKTFHIELLAHLNLDLFTGYIGMMLLGYYVVNRDFKLSNRSLMLLSVIAFICSYIYNIKYSLATGKTVEYLYLSMIIQSLSVFIFIQAIDRNTKLNPGAITSKIHSFIENSKVGLWLTSISICSYGMYYTHYIICQVFKLYHIKSLKLIPILWIITVICSWLITLLLSKIPILDNISGVK